MALHNIFSDIKGSSWISFPPQGAHPDQALSFTDDYIETSNCLCWQEWRSPARRDVQTLCTNVDRMSLGDDRDGAMLRSDKNGFGVEDCTGRTHPRTQHGPVRGRLMLSMVSGMFGSLRLCQTTDGKDAEHERDRKEFSECLAHARRHFPTGI